MFEELGYQGGFAVFLTERPENEAALRELEPRLSPDCALPAYLGLSCSPVEREGLAITNVPIPARPYLRHLLLLIALPEKGTPAYRALIKWLRADRACTPSEALAILQGGAPLFLTKGADVDIEDIIVQLHGLEPALLTVDVSTGEWAVGAVPQQREVEESSYAGDWICDTEIGDRAAWVLFVLSPPETPEQCRAIAAVTGEAEASRAAEDYPMLVAQSRYDTLDPQMERLAATGLAIRRESAGVGEDADSEAVCLLAPIGVLERSCALKLLYCLHRSPEAKDYVERGGILCLGPMRRADSRALIDRVSKLPSIRAIAIDVGRPAGL